MVGETVTVLGTNFEPKETVDIFLAGASVQQVQADEQGGFKMSFEVPDGVEAGSTTISAKGETSERDAQSEFELKGSDGVTPGSSTPLITGPTKLTGPTSSSK